MLFAGFFKMLKKKEMYSPVELINKAFHSLF